jgi:hypothetical protein
MLNRATPPERDRSLSLETKTFCPTLEETVRAGFSESLRGSFVIPVPTKNFSVLGGGFIVTGYGSTQVSPKRKCHESTQVLLPQALGHWQVRVLSRWLQTELCQLGFPARNAAESMSRSQPGLGARGQAFFAGMGSGPSIATRELESQIG